MKLIYLQPQIEVFSSCYTEGSLMAATIESARNLDGGPAEDNEKPLPGTVGNTSEEEDGYGHGVGDPSDPVGGGNRSKSGMIWDEW
jgi:hypothetical protein